VCSGPWGAALITAGIDCGAKTVKVAIVLDGNIVARCGKLTGWSQSETAAACLSEALVLAGLDRVAVARVAATGAGRRAVDFADLEMTEVTADALGAVLAHPPARTVIDVGAEEARAIRCDASGRLLDFALNEKCAAGTGAFTEAMARALEVPVEELGALSLQSTQTVSINAQCAVFAESEVVSLLHANTPRADIARAIHDGIAARIASLVRRVGVMQDLVLIGGLAKNAGFVDSLGRALGATLVVPEWPEYAGATGAALVAAR